jgi:hypothetical protein
VWVVVYRNVVTDEAKLVEFTDQEKCNRFLDGIDSSPVFELIQLKSEVAL